MTRAQIRDELGIIELEKPSIANKELTPKEEADYRKCMNAILKVFRSVGQEDKK